MCFLLGHTLEDPNSPEAQAGTFSSLSLREQGGSGRGPLVSAPPLGPPTFLLLSLALPLSLSLSLSLPISVFLLFVYDKAQNLCCRASASVSRSSITRNRARPSAFLTPSSRLASNAPIADLDLWSLYTCASVTLFFRYRLIATSFIHLSQRLSSP